MVVKFLYTRGPNNSFPAITYNTGKMDRNKGELMKVANFGSLQALGQLRPQDYKNYLKMISAVNKSITKPQLHVAISGGGKSYDKDMLTEIATQWMERMGYGAQPYLVIYHKDTANNHVHIVSTRVSRQGKKIRDGFEQIRGHEQMNIILGIDEKHDAREDIENALAYRFASRVQFLMILESRGYHHKEENGTLLLFKFGRQQGEIPVSRIEDQISKYQTNHNRTAQLKAWFNKYAAAHDRQLSCEHGKYKSAFSVFLKEKMGLELLFHASGDKPPYGYTVIDHSGKQVFKGSEIMALKELLSITPDRPENILLDLPDKDVSQEHLSYYKAILKAALYNYPDLIQGLQHQGLMIIRNGEGFNLHDPVAGVFIATGELLNDQDHRLMMEYFSQPPALNEEIYRGHHHFQGITLTPDVDDEAINGRNRRRKKQARTNNR